MNRISLLGRLATGAAVVLMLHTAPALLDSAEAGRVARIHRGRVILLGKRAPMRFRNDSAFLRFLKVHRKKHIWPQNKKSQKSWKLEFFAFFKRRHNDVEVKIKFFDITERKRFVAGDSIYLAKRGQPILASSIVLRKPRFQVNRKYAMYITNARNLVLATTTFYLRGRRETYSGRVTFSDSETVK